MIKDQSLKKKLSAQGTTASKVQFSRDRRLKISVLKRPMSQNFNHQADKSVKSTILKDQSLQKCINQKTTVSHLWISKD